MQAEKDTGIEVTEQITEELSTSAGLSMHKFPPEIRPYDDLSFYMTPLPPERYSKRRSSKAA